MFLFDEKRKQGDRRVNDQGPPAGCRERRSADERRQTEMAEISFHEWTRHFLKYQERALSRNLLQKAANAPAVMIKSRA